MPKSMTGFAKIEQEGSEGKLYAEARSLNSRYLEVSLKLPRNILGQEQRLREIARKRIKRGRLDVLIRWDRIDQGFGSPKVNEEAVKWYVDLAQHLKDTYGLKGDMTVENIMNMKDIVVYEESQVPEDLLVSTFELLLANLNEERGKEGALTKADLLGRIEKIGILADEIEKRWPEIIDKHAQILREKIEEVVTGPSIDEGRILQEMAIYMERLDIAEEIVRLKGHLNNFRDTLESPEEVGRKLDFIIQEIGRETNTIGSKANDLYISERVVQIKVETEKMREQAQNVE
jgi:uncharacterized protein (TIGR00255 family)